MLLIVALVGGALAQPLSPVSSQPAPFSFDLSATLSSDRLYLRVPKCTGDSCIAIRKEHWQGGEASLWFLPQLAAYGGLFRVVESTAAATYSGGGYKLHGGVKGAVQVTRNAGVAGWISVAHTATQTTGGTVAEAEVEEVATSSDQAQRNQFEVGAVAHLGEPSGGFDGWVGVEAMPYSVDYTQVVQGGVRVTLRPIVPVSAVAGIRMVSDPLGGPWADRGRVSIGLTGEVGYRIGVTGWLTASM